MSVAITNNHDLSGPEYNQLTEPERPTELRYLSVKALDTSHLIANQLCLILRANYIQIKPIAI